MKKQPTQIETIKALRRKMPRPGRVIDAKKRSYQRQKAKQEAKKQLREG